MGSSRLEGETLNGGSKGTKSRRRWAKLVSLLSIIWRMLRRFKSEPQLR